MPEPSSRGSLGIALARVPQPVVLSALLVVVLIVTAVGGPVGCAGLALLVANPARLAAHAP